MSRAFIKSMGCTTRLDVDEERNEYSSNGKRLSGGWGPMAKLIEKQCHAAFREPQTECPWCGQDLSPAGQDSASGNHDTLEAVRALAERFTQDPFAWAIAMLLVANPSGSDRLFAEMLGVGKTKVNDARRRLRDICPEIAALSAEFDNTVRAQNKRRETEGTKRDAPNPLVGTLRGRVHSRFAQRAGSSPAQVVEILLEHTIGATGEA